MERLENEASKQNSTDTQRKGIPAKPDNSDASTVSKRKTLPRKPFRNFLQIVLL